MSKITPESIAELKSLFNDNNKAISANFSQLIDFFNDNKVSDNGDGTYTVGEITIDAKDVITSDDISANVNSVINQKDLATQKYVDDEVSKIPQPDLSNYATQQQLATKADDSKVLHNDQLNQISQDNTGIIVGNDGDFGLVKRSGFKGGLAIGKSNDFHFLLGNTDTLSNSTNYTDLWRISKTGQVSILGGQPFTPIGITDVTTAINTATANMVDSSKATNFTAGLQSGGVDVATAADLKSIKDSAWRQLDLSGTSGRYTGKIRIKIDDTNKTIYLDGAMYFSDGMAMSQGDTIIDLSKVVNSITSAHGYVFFIKGTNESAQMSGDVSELSGSTLAFTGTKINLGSNVTFNGAANYILPYPDPGKSNIYVTYDKLV